MVVNMNLAGESSVIELLTRYGFDLGGQSALSVVRSWSNKYNPSWLSLAVIESLHGGRYKAISVEQILNNWQRHGQATPRFNPEFSVMVTGVDVMIDSQPDGELRPSEDCLLDTEIDLLSAPDTSPNCPAAEPELSTPALDEGGAEPVPTAPHQLLVTAKHQVSLDLTPSNYPPTLPRPPHSGWPQTQEKLPDVFTPSPQVSQFYYKLRAMAIPQPPVDESPPLASDG